jgi:hypothetical protein
MVKSGHQQLWNVGSTTFHTDMREQMLAVMEAIVESVLWVADIRNILSRRLRDTLWHHEPYERRAD